LRFIGLTPALIALFNIKSRCRKLFFVFCVNICLGNVRQTIFCKKVFFWKLWKCRAFCHLQWRCFIIKFSFYLACTCRNNFLIAQRIWIIFKWQFVVGKKLHFSPFLKGFRWHNFEGLTRFRLKLTYIPSPTPQKVRPCERRNFPNFSFREFQNSLVIEVWKFVGNIRSFRTLKNFVKIVWKYFPVFGSKNPVFESKNPVLGQKVWKRLFWGQKQEFQNITNLRKIRNLLYS